MFSDSSPPQPSNDRPKRALGGLVPAQAESAALVVLFLLVGALCLSILGNLILLLNNRALAQRGKTYVQMSSGFSQEAQEFDQLHRESEVIKRTVTTWLQLTFEWDNRLPGSDTTDQGIEFRGTKVPVKAYLASTLLQPGFRQEFLVRLGSDVVPADVYSGARRSLVRFFSLSDPRQVSRGAWEIDVVSTRIELVGGVEEREVPFNRTFRVQAIPPVELALESEGEEPDAFKREVYRLLNNGLVITDITPLDLDN